MKTLGRCLTLAFLSAITAEFLLGDQWLAGAAPLGRQIAELILFAAFYGSAAVLIRELTRRTGRGWPTILLLALAFGILEEGIVDQSLFNPDFAGQHLLANGFIPALGIGGPWTIFVLSLHVIWSIGAPIAIAEALFPAPLPARTPVAPQTRAPWLPAPALIVPAVLFVLGGAAIFAASAGGSGFLASGGQLGASAVLTAAAIVVALLLPRRTPRTSGNMWIAAAIALVLTTAYQLLARAPIASPWLQVGLELGILALGVVLVIVLRLPAPGLGAGAILTYCWKGLVPAVQLGIGPTIEQLVLVVLALGVLAVAVIRSRRMRSGRPSDAVRSPLAAPSSDPSATARPAAQVPASRRSRNRRSTGEGASSIARR